MRNRNTEALGAAEELLESAVAELKTLKSELDALLDGDEDIYNTLADLECSVLDAAAQIGQIKL